jgi:Toprim domain
MMLGRAGGCAIRFGGQAQEILLTEGVENALSIRQVLSLPVWPAGSLGGLKTIDLPRFIAKVTVFADPKPHELRGAEEAARRLGTQGRVALVAYPPDDRDANELLRGDGHHE